MSFNKLNKENKENKENIRYINKTIMTLLDDFYNNIPIQQTQPSP